MKASIYIKSIGTYIPEKILTNTDLEKIVETSDEWIFTRSGIKERHIAAKDETTSDMGALAAKNAIKKAGLKAEDIDLLITATMSPDMLFPSTACVIQSKIDGLKQVTAFDVMAACSGFPYALQVASDMLKGGSYKNALVIGAEKLSSTLDWKDRRTCVLFGDGAAAVVLSKTNQPNVGIIGSVLGANGCNKDLLYMPAGGCEIPTTNQSIEQRQHYLKMNGKEVFKFAVKQMYASSIDILEKHNIKAEELTYIVPHQANIRIIEALAKRLNISLDKFIINIDKYGNTSAASIPLALNDALNEGKIKPGDTILLAAFGAGLTWGTTLIKWY